MTVSPSDEDPSSEVHPISLHVPGVLRLLSEHLYSDPKVVLRELIQNAYDSCQRRRVEDPQSDQFDPRIDIHLDAAKRLFSISDNGSGLSKQEIQDYVATVGRGYTAELRDRLQFGGRSEALQLIGQFGLGLLSAFIVADRIELVTRSYQPDSSAWRWISTGEELYRLGPAERDAPGSTFILHLKLAGEFLLNEDVVRRSIRIYADFLQVPIYLNGSAQPINAIHAPWHIGADIDAYRRFIAERYNMRQPLAILPLRDHVDLVVHPDGSTDQIVTPLAGVLYVPMGSVMSIREFGDVSVYIRRMFITDDERELLPRWAKFVRGVVDSPVLHPTVSREQVRRDDIFYQIQTAIEEQLFEYFEFLAQNDPATWRNIIIAHNDLIKAWALESRSFFDAISDLVTVETSRGRLTIPEYLAASGGIVYYFMEERGSIQEKMLYEAQGLVVIDATRFAEEGFIQAYARTHPEVEVRQLGPGASFLFSDVRNPPQAWETITRYYNEQGIGTRIVKFEPNSIPALLIYPPGSDHVAEARAALDGGDITGPIAGLVEEYLRLRDPQHTATQGVLHLNASSSLMKRLLKLSPEKESFTAALEIVYHNARFFAGRTLTAHEARLGFDIISYSVEELVRAVEEGAQDGQDT